MTLAASEIEVAPPYGPAVAKRGLHIGHQVKAETFSTGTFDAKDISGARWTYQLRLWESDDDSSLLDDETVSKGTNSATGELDHYHSCGATVYADPIRWELVEVDNSNADASTNSGYRERVLQWWRQPIIDAP
jgi:hypothetical protein